MSRETEIEKIADILKEGLWYENCTNPLILLAEHLVDSEIGTKDRFELYIMEGIPCGWAIKGKDYSKEEK